MLRYLFPLTIRICLPSDYFRYLKQHIRKKICLFLKINKINNIWMCCIRILWFNVKFNSVKKLGSKWGEWPNYCWRSTMRCTFWHVLYILYLSKCIKQVLLGLYSILYLKKWVSMKISNNKIFRLCLLYSSHFTILLARLIGSLDILWRLYLSPSFLGLGATFFPSALLWSLPSRSLSFPWFLLRQGEAIG